MRAKLLPSQNFAMFSKDSRNYKTRKLPWVIVLIFAPMCSLLLLRLTQANLAFMYELQYDVSHRAQMTCLSSLFHALWQLNSDLYFLCL